MYQVSDAYKNAMHQPVQKFRLTGTVGTTPFSDENILQGSFSITNQCSDNNEIKIGQVYIGELDVTLIDTNLARYSLKNKIIKPYFGLMLVNESYEDVPLGQFVISQADWTASGIAIKAYDNMSKLDKSCNINSAQGMPYALAKMACDNCGVELGTTQTEFSYFANGSEALSMLADNDIETWRDFMSWVAQSCACNVMADRDGKIIFKAYNQTIIDTINPDERFSGGSFSDFETRYTGISCVNIAEKTTSYYAMENDDGLTYNLGSNPFLQYGVPATLEQQRKAVLTSLQQIDYVPFKLSMIGNPAYDLMDCFSFPDGLGDATKIFCMTKYTFNYHGNFEIEGVGKNPALASAKSKTDKNIAGLMSNSDDEGMHYTVFTNTDEVAVADGENKSVMKITFIVQKQTHVHIEMEFLLDAASTESGEDYQWTENDAVVTVTYYLNGEEITTHYPVETWQDGKHVLHLMYDLQAVAAQIHTWDVWMSMAGGSIHFDQYGMLGVISGVGLVGDSDWNGTISADDNIHAIHLERMFRKFSDSAELKGYTPLSAGNTDSLKNLTFLNMFTKITDSASDTSKLMTFTPWVNADRIVTGCTVGPDGWTGSGSVKQNTAASLITSAVNDVTGIHVESFAAVYYVSFDGGSTWLAHTSDGWQEGASMTAVELEAVTADQWKSGGSSVRIKVLLEDKAWLHTIDLYGGNV